jgi:ABC-type Fe3+/spermidine/putrescine transport system ATPase subunit
MEDLQIIDIEKHYEGETVFSLKPVHLTIRSGEFFSLLGPSGCGKTTLLKLVAGLLQPDSGEVALGENRMTSLAPERRGFGMVFQQPLLFPHMTVEENVAFGLKMQGAGKKERLQEARNMLERVGLKGYGSRYPSALSGGQQQRVSLARALVSKPRLLLMDEPFSALDPELREEMRELVHQLHQQFRLTILFVTHDRDEAFQLSDRIGVMKEGALLQTGTPRELYEQPNHPHVAAFLGAKNVQHGSIRNGRFVSDDTELEVGAMNEQEGWLVVRPEVLRVVKAVSSNEGEYLLEGTVKEISFRQGFYYLKVQIGSVLFDVVDRSEEASAVRVGEKALLQYDVRQLTFIPKRE